MMSIKPGERGKQENSSTAAAAAATASPPTSALLIIPCAVPVSSRDVTGWGWSVSPYSMETYEKATHNHELRPDEDGKVHVHVDSRSMGVGGYDSWTPNVDPSVLVSTGELMCTPVLLVPMKKGDLSADVYLDFLRGKYDLSSEEVNDEW
jgi:Beta galactosidase small chain